MTEDKKTKDQKILEKLQRFNRRAEARYQEGLRQAYTAKPYRSNNLIIGIPKRKPQMTEKLEAQREKMRAVMAERRKKRENPWENNISSPPDMEIFDEVRAFVDSLDEEDFLDGDEDTPQDESSKLKG